MTWLKEVIGTEKAIIAMCHLNALPGDPGFNPEKGMEDVVEWAKKDLMALQDGGVDAVMFSNEFSLPYLTDVKTETVAAMARIIGELMPMIRVPFGVNVLWDARKSLDLAAATGAKFVREIFSGVYASDFGLWNTNVGETIRHQHRIGASGVKLLYNIVPEAAQYLAHREVSSIARTTVFNNRPDALCVSGLTAGAPTDSQTLRLVKDAVPGTVVLANTGMRLDSVETQLSVADGAVVGTTFKYEGIFENHVDVQRVAAFMNKVKQFRKGVLEEARTTLV
ncbi:BtpA/SgcQ family protein [Paenibacillus sp. S150]|uniref:BtpA/SgcQ family protein n=1 Tax=Paenibacillus sp. S150 TaxID=2749826 RepID=UPI001C594577|nr:BtpA/SgcQ family protein [Paenibacillus sp. S150]MBW4081182.1 BtpA/SgcQ family protein [Paenibacillus sp. S150]